MLATNFPFGASDDCGGQTEIHDAKTWAVIDAMRRADRADVATVADPQWTRALSYVARLRVPALRAWATRWLTYCTTGGARPIRHIGEAGKACRRAELKLARLGVVDPYGFEAIEQSAPRSSASREKRRRQKRGGECNGLKEFNERMRAPWVG